MGEKGYWEDHIKHLGGADYKAAAPKNVETYGAELASHTGYKYFGAAKDLPGVRELFETEHIPEAPRKTRKQPSNTSSLTTAAGGTKTMACSFWQSRRPSMLLFRRKLLDGRLSGRTGHYKVPKPPKATKYRR